MEKLPACFPGACTRLERPRLGAKRRRLRGSPNVCNWVVCRRSASGSDVARCPRHERGGNRTFVGSQLKIRSWAVLIAAYGTEYRHSSRSTTAWNPSPQFRFVHSRVEPRQHSDSRVSLPIARSPSLPAPSGAARRCISISFRRWE